MEFEQLLTLINAVSASTLTTFKYEEKGTKLCLQKEVTGVVVTKSNHETVEQIEVPAPVIVAEEAEGQIVLSPLVGTFYAAPSEEAEAFVQVGDRVGVGQTLAIVEAMKLMNEIESEYAGEVVEIFVKNGETVEYGQPLFRIRE